MDRFIARQPIFDLKKKVYGYELLFRSSLDNFFDTSDQEMATSRVIADSFLLFSIEEMTGGAKAFINFTRNTLLQDYVTVLPRQSLVVEILEGVVPDKEVFDACRRLKQAGFTLALDDFIYAPAYEKLLPLVDIVKVDFLAGTPAECFNMASAFSARGITLLAEKVETQEVFDLAVEMGYRLFQGYFFSKPVVLSRRDIPGSRLHYLRIIQEINAIRIDFSHLAQTVQADMSLSYKLLKFINSAAFGLLRKVTSIEHALTLLGERELRKWISLVALTEMASDKPPELVACSLVRARSLELIAPLTGMASRKSNLFLIGLFSLLDAIMDRPLEELLRDIPMEEDSKDALLGGHTPQSELLELVVGMERGDWDGMERICTGLHLDGQRLAEIHLESLQWVDRLFAE